MKKILFLISILINFSTLNCNSSKSKINLIWQVDRHKIWETDWILELLSDFQVTQIDDPDFKVFSENSIIVTSRGCDSYFSVLNEFEFNYGIINLSDEVYSFSTQCYEKAAFVFRNYWHKKFLSESNTSIFALGYKQGLWKDCLNREIKPAYQRKYTWSFAGQINGYLTRNRMHENMKKIPNFYVHEIHAWLDSNSLSIGNYRDLFLNSLFIPCPRGYWNLDSFRVYEALECGCIPIVEKTPLDYFNSLFKNCPFLIVENWDQAPALIQSLLEDPLTLEERRQKCHQWWIDYKNETKLKFKETILKTLKSKDF